MVKPKAFRLTKKTIVLLLKVKMQANLKTKSTIFWLNIGLMISLLTGMVSWILTFTTKVILSLKRLIVLIIFGTRHFKS